MTDSNSVSTRPCNKGMIKYLMDASELRFKGKMTLYEEYQPVPHPPMWLTDRHLASAHSLQRVVIVSNLVKDMARDINIDIVRFLSENDNFPGVKSLPTFVASTQHGISSASTVMHTYEFQISRICETVATSMYILPNQRQCGQVYSLRECQPCPRFLNQAKLKVSRDYRQLDVPDFSLQEVAIRNASPATLQKLRVIRDNHPCLATFNFLPPCPYSDYIVMDAAEDYSPGSWITPATVSPTKLDFFDRPLPLDIPNKWWGKYSTHVVSSSAKRVQRDVITHRRTVWIPPRKGTRHQHEPEPREFIQRAWCHAVETDTTFMVINSGNHERIGIRHRETQTLFLSNIICPLEILYVRMHMFLHASILKEAMERVTPQPVPDGLHTSPTSLKQTCHSDIDGRRVSKRLRGESPTTPDSGGLDVQKEISRRNILLVSFDFGVYHSSSPSSFLRVSSSCHPEFVSMPVLPVKANKKYPFTECMNFVASETIGSGGSGTAFRGVVQIQTDTGSTVEANVVLKIPLGAQPVSKMHDEYQTYVKFAKAGLTEGILPVYGVFEDVESDSAVMMMGDGGTDLWQRERARKGPGFDLSSQISLSQDEFDILYQVVKRINTLNIQHSDVKPNNILCDENGKLFLIDFDLACQWPEVWRHGDTDSLESADILNLRDLLAGTFVQDKNCFR